MVPRLTYCWITMSGTLCQRSR